MREHTSFDFDAWMQLAKDNPEAFEKQRRKAIESILCDSSGYTRKRLEGLQWQIDSVRQTADNPMVACLKISQMMWEKIKGEDGLVDVLNQLVGQSPIKPKSSNIAKVVPLHPKDPDRGEKLVK